MSAGLPAGFFDRRDELRERCAAIAARRLLYQGLDATTLAGAR